MKLFGKILLSTLPLVLLGFIVAGGVTYYMSRSALNEIGIQWLETRSNEALSVAREQAEYLSEYGLDNIESSVKQAQIDTTTMMANIIIGDEGFVFIVNDDGKIVDHPDNALIGLDVGTEPWFSEINKRRTGSLNYSFRGSDYLASFHHFETWNWFIIVTDPTSELFGVVNKLGFYVLVLGIVGSLLIALALMLLTRRVTAPLATLVAGAENVGRGKLDTQIDVNTSDEIGVLSHAFNEMTNQLRALYDRLEERLTAVVSNAPIILFSIDAQGTITLLEGKELEILGLGSESMVGQNIKDVFAQAPAFLQSINRALSGELVNEIVEFDDLKIEVWCSQTSDKLEGNVIGITTDVTERIQAQERLLEQNSMLESVSTKLSKYLSPQVYASIFSGKQSVKISSKRKKLTIFFSDIANFTETADKMESEDLTQLLNQYLTEMAKIALQHGATIDKYVGDAIVIFFGDPETRGVKEDALFCVKMAIAMRERMLELENTWRRSGIETPLKCRIGINTGYCTVGNFGSEDRMDYTIIGGGVNLASRLETVAEPGEILISYETYANVQDEIQCKEHGQVTVKGLAYPVATYVVEDSYSNIGSARKRIHEELPNLKLEMNSESMSKEQRALATDILQKALDQLSDS